MGRVVKTGWLARTKDDYSFQPASTTEINGEIFINSLQRLIKTSLLSQAHWLTDHDSLHGLGGRMRRPQHQLFTPVRPAQTSWAVIIKTDLSFFSSFSLSFHFRFFRDPNNLPRLPSPLPFIFMIFIFFHSDNHFYKITEMIQVW